MTVEALPQVSKNGPPVVAVVGLGFGGLAAGIYLKRAKNLDSFVIFEKSAGIGGTWRHQRYPGAACDFPTHYYSFSFELNPNWSRELVPREEIKAYQEMVFDKYKLEQYCAFNSEILSATFNEDEGVWDLHIREFTAPHNQLEKKAADEEGQWEHSKRKREIVKEYIFKANILFNSNGAFTRPFLPDYPGQGSFQGKVIHTVEWDDSVVLEDQRVALIGTGPTSLQVSSQIAKKVKQLDIYQRTAAWVLPWGQQTFTEEQKEIWRKDPAALQAKRDSLASYGDNFWVTVEDPNGPTHLAYRQSLIDYLKANITKPELIPKLTPDFPVGCKRFLLDCGYYEALNQPNCDLITDRISAVTPKGLKTHSKETGTDTEREYDVIIWATGWGSFSFGRAFPVYGRKGIELWDYWRNKRQLTAYMGHMCSGFPNQILVNGPNGLPFDSYIDLLEIRSEWMLRMIDEMVKRNAQTCEPKEELENAYNLVCNQASKKSPFGGNCISYYKFTWDSWDEAKEGGGHVGKQDDQYTEYESPFFWPALPSEYRLIIMTGPLDNYVWGAKDGKWEMPAEPKEKFNPLRKNPTPIRAFKDGFLYKEGIAKHPEMAPIFKQAFAPLLDD